MKIIVCGAGQVGAGLARHLTGSGHDVTVIEPEAHLSRRMVDTLDLKVTVGSATHPSVLAEAGADEADMLVAVTRSDTVNMLACTVAGKLFDVPVKIARIRNEKYLDTRFGSLFSTEAITADHIISPEQAIAEAIRLRLDVQGARNIVPFADDEVRLAVLRCHAGSAVLDTPLRQLSYLFPDLELVIAAIGRKQKLFIPTADDRLMENDDVYVMMPSRQAGLALPVFGYDEPAAQHVCIIGGGNVAFLCAKHLENDPDIKSIRLIEINPERAEEIAPFLERTIVINGDARDPEILGEAHVEVMDVTISLTRSDEINVMTALLAHQAGSRHVLALVNNTAYERLNDGLPIDGMISPRDITISSVLRHVRRGRMRAVHAIRQGEIEILEADALDTSFLVGKQISDLNLPRGIKICAIMRGKDAKAVRPETMIMADDRVILAAEAEHVSIAEKLFSVRVDFV